MINYVYVIAGVVVGFCRLYDLSGNSKCSGPEGSTEHIVPENSPVTIGWRYFYDEDAGKMAFFPPA